MNRCAFLMSSCDVYEDLWEPFFECLALNSLILLRIALVLNKLKLVQSVVDFHFGTMLPIVQDLPR